VDHEDDTKLEAWIKAAGYSRHPFDIRYLYAENYPEDGDRLEEHFTAHTGCFQEYVGPSSTIIVGARGSGKTANCIKLEKALCEGPGNFVLAYNALAPWQSKDTPFDLSLKHHLHEIIRLGIRQLLKTRGDTLSRESERELQQLDVWCQEFHRQADYQSRLELLVQKVLEVGYEAVYLLIDEQQSPWREPARTPELLSPLLDESLFNHNKLYVKLFVPQDLTQDAEDLRR